MVLFCLQPQLGTTLLRFVVVPSLAHSNSKISLADSFLDTADSQLAADFCILNLALQQVLEHSYQVQNIFISNSSIVDLLSSLNHVCSWRFRHWIININHLLSSVGSPRVCVVPRAWLNVVLKFANYGRPTHQLSFFTLPLIFLTGWWRSLMMQVYPWAPPPTHTHKKKLGSQIWRRMLAMSEGVLLHLTQDEEDVMDLWHTIGLHLKPLKG